MPGGVVYNLLQLHMDNYNGHLNIQEANYMVMLLVTCADGTGASIIYMLIEMYLCCCC